VVKSFGLKLAAAFFLMLACISTGIGLYALNTMNIHSSSLIEDHLKTNLALGNELLESGYPGDWRLEGGRLYKGEAEISKRFPFITTMVNLSGHDVMFYFNSGKLATANFARYGNDNDYNLNSETLATVLGTKQSTVSLELAGLKQTIGKMPIIDNTGQTIGFWAIKMPQQKMQAMVRKTQVRMMAGAYMAMIGTGIIFYFLTRIISKPIPQIVEGMTRAESGDLTVRLDINTNDEFAQLGSKFNSMVENISGLLKNIWAVSEEVANSAEDLHAATEESSKTTEQITATVHMVATGTEDQAKSVEQTTMVIGDMSKGIQDVAEHSQNVLKISRTAGTTAANGTEAIGNAVRQMQYINKTVNATANSVRTLGEKSQLIGYIVDVITGIAKQTNLLALNAAIEAARAGEQGRGFAVVAEEVRKLAEQSAGAAKEISDLILEIREETEKAVAAMENVTQEVTDGTCVVNEAGTAFEEIVNSINNVTDRIQEVSIAAEQMAAGAQEAVAAMQNIASISEETAASAEQVAAAAQEQTASSQEVAAATSMLARLADDLRVRVTDFKV